MRNKREVFTGSLGDMESLEAEAKNLNIIGVKGERKQSIIDGLKKEENNTRAEAMREQNRKIEKRVLDKYKKNNG